MRVSVHAGWLVDLQAFAGSASSQRTVFPCVSDLGSSVYPEIIAVYFLRGIFHSPRVLGSRGAVYSGSPQCNTGGNNHEIVRN